MTLHARTISPDQLSPWGDVVSTAFFGNPPTEEVTARRQQMYDLDRTWGVYDGDRIVATLRSFASELTLPGATSCAADAVTAVTVLPTHRRRGAMTAAMSASLASAVERGEPVSILIAARWRIYGRFGYAPASDHTSLTVVAGEAEFRAPARAEVEYVDRETGRDAARDVFERFRRTQPGAIPRLPHFWDIDFGLEEWPGQPKWEGRCVLARDERGDVVGYLRYHVTEKWEHREPANELQVDDLVAVTPAAYAALWRLCVEMDNVAVVKADDRSPDELLPWLLHNGRAVHATSTSDFLWLRVLDVPAALSARRYLTADRVVLEVADPLGYAAGRFALEGGPDGATCKPTDESPEITLPVSSLGTAYLGNTSLRMLAGAGLVDEHAPGALARADAMLRADVTPWCNTWF